MRTNEASEWGEIWSRTSNDISVELDRHRQSLLYRRILYYLEEKLSALNGKTTIEIGSGSGIYSLLFAQLGASVTMLDYSVDALKLAETNLKTLNLNAQLVQADAFNPPSDIGQFDIAMSFGTVEHYRPPKRFAICKTHADLVRPGGVLLIETPNVAFLPHEILKFVLQHRNKWRFGYERCYSWTEMRNLGKKLNLNNIQIVGSSLRHDLREYKHIFNNTALVRHYLYRDKQPTVFEWGSAPQKAIALDNYIARSIALLGVKS